MKKSELTDNQLAQKALQDMQYFKILIEKYQKQIQRYIMRLSNVDEDESNDVLQEVFIKAWKNIESFNGQYAFSAWLYRIARNETINYYKKHLKKNAEHTMQVSAEHLESIAGSLNQRADYDLKLKQKKVAQAIEKLDTKYREIIILHFFEQKSFRDISDIMRLPLGTVATMFKKAREQLFQSLHELKGQDE